MTNYFHKHIENISFLSPLLFLILSLWLFDKTIKNKNHLKTIRLICKIIAVISFLIIYSKREFNIYKTDGYQKVISDLLEMSFFIFTGKYAMEIEAALNNTIKRLFKRNKL
ncbi:hypothetical protein [Paenibacillus albus]|uniref:Uncharacterized protein n=1 Tax=Paenibacillus albus TaxID=2495582 RepID=A0A3S9A7L9_9BACL|nr:hypothetical protein [Paenibacillus albus]AZN41703.1 hypothetical protein EJC50_20005 [Paenibacillus albus]